MYADDTDDDGDSDDYDDGAASDDYDDDYDHEDLFIKLHIIYSIILSSSSLSTYLPSSQHDPSRECFPHGLLIVRN